MRLYNVAYALGLVWFAGFAFFAATQPGSRGAGVLTGFLILGIALAPCVILTIGKRIVTGRWIG